MNYITKISYFLENSKILGRLISVILLIIALIKSIVIIPVSFELIFSNLKNLSDLSSSTLYSYELEYISIIVFSIFLMLYLAIYLIITILKSIELSKSNNTKELLSSFIKYIGQISFVFGLIVGLGSIISYEISNDILSNYLRYFDISFESESFYKKIFFSLPILGLFKLIFCYFVVEVLNILYNINENLLDIKTKYYEYKTII